MVKQNLSVQHNSKLLYILLEIDFQQVIQIVTFKKTGELAYRYLCFVNSKHALYHLK